MLRRRLYVTRTGTRTTNASIIDDTSSSSATSGIILIITVVCRADARAIRAVGEHAEGRAREQRRGAHGRGMCRVCACGPREAWCVVLGVVWARDGLCGGRGVCHDGENV